MIKQIEYDADVAEFEVIDGESDDISDLQKDIDSQITDIYSEFGGEPNEVEFRIDVKRTIPNKGTNEDCFSCTIEELPIKERIRKEFGPGLYQIYIYKNKKLFRRRTLRLAAPVKQPVINTDGFQGGGIKDILTAMAENQQRQFEQMRELMVQQVPQQSQAEQMQSTLQTMALMKQIMGEPAKPADPMKTIELAKSLAEMMDGGGDKSSLDRLIDTVLPALLEGAKMGQHEQASFPGQGMMRAPQTHTMQVPVKTNPQSRPEFHQGQPKPENETDMIKLAVKNKLPQLVAWASQDKDPAFYAEFVLDNMPDAFMGAYCDFVQKPDAVSQLGIMNPEVNRFIPWFESFRAETMEMIKEAQEEEETLEPLTKPASIDHDSDHVSDKRPGPVIEGESEKPDNGDT